ncbi:MAG TPA: hypothetical protein VEK33_17960 [Terriglobales bacterium]|nr:hypothetical protein [Terriglobales bacterium]
MNAKIQLALWISHPVLELLLASALVWRRLYRRFPVFFAFVVFQLLHFAVLFPIHQSGNYKLYFYSYWISSTIDLTFGFLVIHEIFLDVFRAYHTLRDLGTILFKWAALVMMIVALVVAVSAPTERSPIVVAVLTMQRCVRVIQCGLVLFLMIFSNYLAVSWKQPSFGIALGMGVLASTQLAGNALYSGLKISGSSFALANTSLYCCTVLVWLGYAAMKAAAPVDVATALVSQRWERSLTDLQHPAPAGSLIPMFERMVDRALSRNAEQSEHLEYRALDAGAIPELPPSVSISPSLRPEIASIISH